jgi:demethylmenaquinone methyltransferase / 2-methoxy-6-polyprenyl-1,4-benzoquinol methylase
MDLRSGTEGRRSTDDPRGVSSCPMSEKHTSSCADFGFRRVPAAEKAPLVRAIFDNVATRYDLMNDLMSGGLHRWWKSELIASLKPRPGQRLLDVAGGTGDIAMRAIPRLAPAGRSTGGAAVVCDVSAAMLEIGRARALDQGVLEGLEWVCADAERLPVADRSADLYTVGFGLRNVTRIDAALAEARRVLKPGGRFLCLEFTPEISPSLQPLYDLYSFGFVPLLGQIVAGDRDAYTYLVESIRRFPRQSELAEMLVKAGFDRVQFRNLTGGVAALHSAWRL